jgi:membrane associated rhomboid family serine protease
MHENEPGAPTTPDYEPAPEDFLPSPRKPLGPFRRWPPLFPYFFLPLFLAIVSLAVSLVSWSASTDLFSVSAHAVWQQGNYWRLLTALFDHANIAHWGLNMMPFLFFGWLLSAYFGKWMFLIGGLFVGVFSNAATVLIYPPKTSLIGASGVVYGIIAMWLVLYIKFDDEREFAKKAMRVGGFILMLLFPTAYEHTTSYLAHATGFLFGIAFAVLALPFTKLTIFSEPTYSHPIFVRRSFRVRKHFIRRNTP